ncbi:MAG: glutamine-hydrolyzing GMP synthase [Chitinophagales bacterium]|nr:glutamine-hydrolyzing GMP synthase [Chitinophagales bacterium]
MIATGIIILDFGSQYNQLIARRIRSQKVFAEILPYHVNIEEIKSKHPKGIILSGGPSSVISDDGYRISQEIFDLGIPVLGICYGMQLMSQVLGGQVAKGKKAEYGKSDLTIHESSKLLNEIPKISSVWMSHFDEVIQVPQGFEINATSENSIAAIAHEERKLYGLQFHPEVTHTDFGSKIFDNFIFEICQCEHSWDNEYKTNEIIAEIKQTVGNDQVVLGLSGGVDSSVCAVLLHRAIGSQLTCIFVDTGLMRHREAEKVLETYRENLQINIVFVDAKFRFYEALRGIDEPEAKRKVIGKLFIDIFQEEAKKIKNVKFLAQGTIYSDVIESSASKLGQSHTIKSHHNVGGLPKDLNLILLEPLRFMFKDEVRLIGKSLGIPDEMIDRHPFPGPGLGIRILGEITSEKVAILQKADAIFIEELEKADLYHSVNQAFAVLLNDRSVGVKGDTRTYLYTLVLRSANSIDFMTATWSRLPYDFLDKVSSRIINEVDMINRVVYDISSKPPATIEWE